jgi:hypothetical protein
VQVTLTLMTEQEARACVEEIKGHLETTRALLFNLHEREGWRALGYETWQRCITEEFAMSRFYAHRLLNAHMVDRILSARSEALPIGNAWKPVAEIPEAHARELGALLPDEDAVRDVYAEVQEATDGEPTAARYREAVDRRLGVFPPTERQAVVLQAIDDAQPLLDEPESEKALYALSRVAFWLYLDPGAVADAAAEPSQDAPGYAELAAWVAAIAAAIRARADGLRVVR